MKKRIYPANYDFGTGFFSHLFLIIGSILLLIYLNENYNPYNLSLTQSMLEIILSFSIIFIGLGMLLYLLHYLFMKLSRIADEVEKELIEEEK